MQWITILRGIGHCHMKHANKNIANIFVGLLTFDYVFETTNLLPTKLLEICSAGGEYDRPCW